MLKKKILIMGDSWACGEWGHDDNGVYTNLHKGLKTFLSEGVEKVVSIASSGHGNFDQLNHFQKIKNKLRGVIDLIIFIQTDPMRDAESIPLDLGHYREQQKKILNEFYARLNSLNLPVLMVGGNFAISEKSLYPYKNLKCVCADWYKLLIGEHRPCEIFCRKWKYPDVGPDLLSFFETQETHFKKHLEDAETPTSECHKWFWPDGRHPNRDSHKVLTELILRKLIQDKDNRL